MKTIAIDPSINSLGFAYFDNEKLTTYKTLKAPSTIKKGSDETRLLWMITEVKRETLAIDLGNQSTTFLIERPQSWGAYKSVASQHSGALLILHLLVGALFATALELGFDKVYLVPVSDWKGQLPKRVTMERMSKKYNITKFSSDDVADAIGLGTWFIERNYHV